MRILSPASVAAATERHRLHHLELLVRTEGSTPADLSDVLSDLSFVPLPRDDLPLRSDMELTARAVGRTRLPADARPLFDREGISAAAAGEGVYMTEGTSLLQLRPQAGTGTALLAPGFASQARTVRHRFWAVGLMVLLRSRGLFGLHAAALVSPDRVGVLLIGPSGSGKSTLAIGLVRDGWQYLSDDAVALCRRDHQVVALALRKPFSIVPHGRIDAAKQRVDMRSARPGQFRADCRPHVLVFTRVAHAERSTIRPVAAPTSLAWLLEQSAPELFHGGSMPTHLALLAALTRQAASYELRAGEDLYDHPGLLTSLVANVGGACAPARR